MSFPGALPARAPRRRRRRGAVWVAGACLAVVVVVATVLAWPGRMFCDGFVDPFTSTYSAQVARSAEFVGSSQGPYTKAQVDTIAANTSYMFIPKFVNRFDIHTQFQQAKDLKAAAAADGHPLKVFLYISATFWFTNNVDGWKPYSDSFNKNWYLDDANGDPIPYWGLDADRTKDPIGYQVDLTNKAYRNWVTQLATSWTHDAPVDGIVFDNADPLIGTADLRSQIGDGESTTNQTLCGSSTKVDSDGNCPRVAAWNTGLREMLQQVTDALEPSGKEVIYNGVAPSHLRVNRNQALASVTSGATNESFCYNLGVANKDKISLNPVPDDLAMMKSFAQQGKKIFEITNYQSDTRTPYGPYCLGSFLLGWQPGSSFFIYHKSYSAPTDSLPVLPEQNLDLGTPQSTGYTTSGDVLSRTFTRGFVAVNIGDKSATYTVPEKGTRYEAGQPTDAVEKGSTVTLPAHTAAFFLTTASLPSAGQLLGVC